MVLAPSTAAERIGGRAARARAVQEEGSMTASASAPRLRRGPRIQSVATRSACREEDHRSGGCIEIGPKQPGLLTVRTMVRSNLTSVVAEEQPLWYSAP